MVVNNDSLYVALQRLDRNAGFVPQTSITLEIECSSQSVVNAWEMGSNIEIFTWG